MHSYCFYTLPQFDLCPGWGNKGVMQPDLLGGSALQPPVLEQLNSLDIQVRPSYDEFNSARYEAHDWEDGQVVGLSIK